MVFLLLSLRQLHSQSCPHSNKPELCYMSARRPSSCRGGKTSERRFDRCWEVLFYRRLVLAFVSPDPIAREMLLTDWGFQTSMEYLELARQRLSTVSFEIYNKTK